MQLVIEISREQYECVRLTGHIGNTTAVSNAILNGTPLPEHHGRLIDVDELLDDIGLEDNDENRVCNTGEIITLEDIDRISIIIPATKEGDGE